MSHPMTILTLLMLLESHSLSKATPVKISLQCLHKLPQLLLSECGDSLDGIFCQQCTCKSCGKGAHVGYNCPPKASIISNPEPCNQTIDELPQTLPSFDPTCYSEKENSLPYVSKPNFVDDSPNVFNPPSQPPVYSCEFCGKRCSLWSILYTSSSVYLSGTVLQSRL
ncbi:hypothetical protein Tco_0272930 [Tanacetum coccineum]